MPYFELLSYLDSNGDSILYRTDKYARTEKGLVYVRSYEGMFLFRNIWVTKEIWCRLY